jgi:DNA-binding transcriptional ArsR family regulator
VPTKLKTRKSEEVLKALSHPIRLALLQVLGERVASPNEMSKEIGEHVTTVSYHVRVLLEADCIELVDTQQRRGATEHFYRAIQRGELRDEDWQRLSQDQREEVSALTRRELLVQIYSAEQAGTFDSRKDRHLSWAPMNLDDEGFAELNQLLTATLEGSFDIQAASTARMSASGDSGKPAVVGLMSFEAAGRKALRH